MRWPWILAIACVIAVVLFMMRQNAGVSATVVSDYAACETAWRTLMNTGTEATREAFLAAYSRLTPAMRSAFSEQYPGSIGITHLA